MSNLQKPHNNTDTSKSQSVCKGRNTAADFDSLALKVRAENTLSLVSRIHPDIHRAKGCEIRRLINLGGERLLIESLAKVASELKHSETFSVPLAANKLSVLVKSGSSLVLSSRRLTECASLLINQAYTKWIIDDDFKVALNLLTELPDLKGRVDIPNKFYTVAIRNLELLTESSPNKKTTECLLAFAALAKLDNFSQLSREKLDLLLDRLTMCWDVKKGDLTQLHAVIDIYTQLIVSGRISECDERHARRCTRMIRSLIKEPGFPAERLLGAQLLVVAITSDSLAEHYSFLKQQIPLLWKRLFTPALSAGRRPDIETFYNCLNQLNDLGLVSDKTKLAAAHAETHGKASRRILVEGGVYAAAHMERKKEILVDLLYSLRLQYEDLRSENLKLLLHPDVQKSIEILREREEIVRAVNDLETWSSDAINNGQNEDNAKIGIIILSVLLEAKLLRDPESLAKNIDLFISDQIRNLSNGGPTGSHIILATLVSHFNQKKQLGDDANLAAQSFFKGILSRITRDNLLGQSWLERKVSPQELSSLAIVISLGFISNTEDDVFERLASSTLLLRELCIAGDESLNVYDGPSAELLRALSEVGWKIKDHNLAKRLIDVADSDARMSKWHSNCMDDSCFASFEELDALLANLDDITDDSLRASALSYFAQKIVHSYGVSMAASSVFAQFINQRGPTKLCDIISFVRDPSTPIKFHRWLCTHHPSYLQSIDLSDGGDAVSNFHEHMNQVFNGPWTCRFETPADFPTRRSVKSEELGELPDYLDQLLSSGSTQLGRTLMLSTSNDQATYIKLMKRRENPECIVFEHDVMQFIYDHKESWGLKGEYPKPVGVYRVPSSKLTCKIGKDNSICADNWDIPLAVSTDDEFVALVYQAPREYAVYLNDPSISSEEFEEAFRVNLHDRIVMLRRGLVDPEIIELFHNQEHAEGRLYDWMIDTTMNPDGRSGAGRMNDIPLATLYPNLRLSGPADFAAMRVISELVDNPSLTSGYDGRLQRLTNLAQGNKNEVAKYIWAAFYGDMLLSFSLILATRLQRRGELNYDNEKENAGTWFQEQLKILFPESAADMGLIAQQMAFFMNQLYISQDPESLYEGVNMYLDIEGARGCDPSFGWDISNGKRYIVRFSNFEKTLAVRSYDLGPVNGPSPLQELIKAIYEQATYETVVSSALH